MWHVILLTGSDKKVEYNLLRTRTISTDDIISPNFKIYALNGGKEYRVSYTYLIYDKRKKCDWMSHFIVVGVIDSMSKIL